MRNLGLVEIDASVALKETNDMLEGIQNAREEENAKFKREFAVDYSTRWWYRLWNVGIREAINPIPLEDLSSELIEERLDKMYTGFSYWRSEKHYYAEQAAHEVAELAVAALSQPAMDGTGTIFVNQEHARFLNKWRK